MNGPDILAPTRDQKLAPMSCEPLTRDNPQLSRPNPVTIETLEQVWSNSEGARTLCSAINCTDQLPAEVLSLVQDLVEDSISPNSRRAYLSDLAHFEAWGGRIPASPLAVACYLAANAETLSVEPWFAV